MNKQIEDIKLVQLPKIEDSRGNLTFVEELKHVPFKMERSYWIYDVPGGETRGGHAFINQQEVIIALSGSLDVIVNDSKEEKRFSLNRSYYGLYIPEGIWRHMENFSTNALVIVLSSTPYNSEDYIRDFEEYKKYKLNEVDSL